MTANGEPRDELLYEGLEYEAIAELVQQVAAVYLQNWSRAVGPGQQLPFPERTARAIAAYMLDAGFHSDFLHRWWTRQIRRDERNVRSLSAVLEEASALVISPVNEYTVLLSPFRRR